MAGFSHKAYQNEAISFWKENIKFDLNFFDAIFQAYPETWIDLYARFKDTSLERIAVQPLSVPNEVCDYIDGNGFTCTFIGGMMIITKEKI